MLLPWPCRRPLGTDVDGNREFIALFQQLPDAVLAGPDKVDVVDWAGAFDGGDVDLVRGCGGVSWATSSLNFVWPQTPPVEAATNVLARYRTFMDKLQTLRSCLSTLHRLRSQRSHPQ